MRCFKLKKEIIIICGIIISIIVLHIISQKYTENFFEEISATLSNLEEMLRNNGENDDSQKQEAEKRIDELQDKWKSKYGLLACFIEHDELEKVHTKLISIDANISVNDYDRTIDEIETCLFLLKHIENKDALKVINIF